MRPISKHGNGSYHLNQANQTPPQNKEQATRIDLLNLNSPFLQVERRTWWDELDTLFAEHLSNATMDLYCLAAIDLVPTAGKLSPFFSITRQLFGPIAEKVLQQEVPELL